MRNFATFLILLKLSARASSQAPDEDSVVVEAEEGDGESSAIPSRWERQFVSVTGIGQFPGFPPGWPFGIQMHPPQVQQLPALPPLPPLKRPSPPQQQRPSQPTPPPRLESCTTVRGDKGRCSTLAQCYPVLYSSGDTGNDTHSKYGEELRNPVLAEILRYQVSGPCDAPGEIVNQFLFRADAEYRRKLVCCPVEPPNRPLKETWTTTTRTPVQKITTVRQIQQIRPFGHRPPTQSPGKRTTTTVQPIVASSCGIPKIVGGTETTAGKFPWVVALMNGQKQFCGGSLIDNQHVLTAAHCVGHMRSQEVARVRVLLGTHSIHSISSRTIVKKVAKLVRHRFFSHQTLHNDVAVLKLDSPVKFSDYISPICLARGQNRFANLQGVVAGWGSVSEHGGQPSNLREVTIDIWPNEKCKGKYGHLAPGGITEHMMCAGSVSQDACRGDSGGPLMAHTGNYYEQIGIVSWGIGCGRFPGVYSRVTDFYAWITKNIQ